MSALYKAAITRLAEYKPAEEFQRVEDLPELEPEELGAVIRHCRPVVFIDAIAECDVELWRVVVEALESGTPQLDVIGSHVVEALRRHVLPTVLRDVQKRIEQNRTMDDLEGCFRRENFIAI